MERHYTSEGIVASVGHRRVGAQLDYFFIDVNKNRGDVYKKWHVRCLTGTLNYANTNANLALEQPFFREGKYDDDLSRARKTFAW